MWVQTLGKDVLHWAIDGFECIHCENQCDLPINNIRTPDPSGGNETADSADQVQPAEFSKTS